MSLKNIGLVAMIGMLLSCGPSGDISLDNFSSESDVFASGKSLMGLSFGLHDLEDESTNQTSLLIAVHGSNSRGYEWIYPLQTLDEPNNLVSFFRWDDDNCPGPSVSSLLELIKSRLIDSDIENVILYGHSYGGLLVTIFMNEWDLDVPLQVHSIAGPLKRIDPLSNICEFEVPESINIHSSLHQWRTIKELDGAFKDLEFDPQNAEIKGSDITRLPETYKGKKLGHNWSISWVADEIKKID
tara:strand:+ start:543 stop:1268 length:726 start_codon:yes stop_codon:yes gene_type:complete